MKIPFDQHWKSVAVSQSGGADSAVLVYLICSQAPSDFLIHIISQTRMWKTRLWQQEDNKLNWRHT